jgi:DNA-binding LacI/PurR family transcriptional regulator
MKNKAGILEVARVAGVSSASVSRVLSGQTVREKTQARVLAAIADLGYQPNQMAQGLRKGRGTTVALLVGDIEQGVYASLTKEIQAALEAVGLDLLLFNLGHSPARLKRFLARIDAMGLHGIVIAASDMLTEDNIQMLADKVNHRELPVFSVGLSLDQFGIPSINYDDRASVARSVRFLLDTYGGPVAYLGRIEGSASGTQRYLGYEQVLEEKGLALDRHLVWDAAYRYRAGFDSTDRALRDAVKFRSIQAGSDELALGAMAALREHGKRIPEDVAVIGIGNVEPAAYSSPTLTTHGVCPDQIARHIAKGLQTPASARTHETLILERAFIRRASA